MSSQLPPIPYANPLNDKNGNLSSGWINWFRYVYSRIGGATALTNLELAALFPVGTSNIASGAVTSTQLASGSVTSAAIASGAVLNAAISAGVIAFSKLLTTDWTNSQATSGYQKLGSGLYVQWGVTGSIATGTNTAVTFPVAFPTACFQVIAGIQGNSAGVTTATGQWGTGTYSTTGFTLNNRTSAAYTFNYLAVGN